MKASCRDLERVLQDAGADRELATAFDAHAATCAACARELAEWRQVSEAARTLPKSWDTPELWPAIHQTLAEESQRASRGERSGGFHWRWLPAASIVALFAIATAGLWVFRNSGGRDPLTAQWQTTKDPLLTDQAVDEVETAEKACSVSSGSFVVCQCAVSGSRPPLLRKTQSPAVAIAKSAMIEAAGSQRQPKPAGRSPSRARCDSSASDWRIRGQSCGESQELRSTRAAVDTCRHSASCRPQSAHEAACCSNTAESSGSAPPSWSTLSRSRQPTFMRAPREGTPRSRKARAGVSASRGRGACARCSP